MKAVVQSPFALERAGIVGVIKQVWPEAEVIAGADKTELAARPDWHQNVHLLVVDWRSSRIARELIETFKRDARTKAPAVVAFCDQPDMETTRFLVSMGVRAVAPLTLDPSLVSALLPFVLAGGTYLPRSVLETSVDRSASVAPARNTWAPRISVDDPALSGLTRRQKEVLRHISSGMSNEEIAAELGVTLNTVKSHVSSMLRALGVKRRTQAMRMLSQQDARL